MKNVKSLLDGLLSKLPAPIAGALKAVAAAALPLLTVSLANGSFDWKGVLAAGLTALAVYLVPNRPKPVAVKK